MGKSVGKMNDWIIGPIGKSIQYITEEIDVLTVAVAGLSAIQSVPGLIEAAKKLDEVRANTDLVDRLNQMQKMSEDHSSEIARLNGKAEEKLLTHSLIGIWALMESTIETTIQNLLERKIPIKDQIAEQLGTPSLIEKVNTQNPAAAFKTLERHAMKRSGSWNSATLLMFHAFDIRIDETKIDSKALDEFNAFRNIHLHRDGIVDEKFLRDCPWLKLRPGERLGVDKAKYGRLIEVASQFLLETLKAVGNSPYMTSHQGEGY